MVVSLFVGVWVARYLGPEQFGLLSYVQAYVGLFIVFSTLGLDGIVVRELVKNENDRDELLGSAFVLKLCGSLILIFLTLLISYLNNETSFNILLILIFSLTSIFQSLNVIDFYFQSKVISKFTVYANFIVLISSSVIKVFLILNKFSLIYFVLVFLIDAGILAFSLLFFYNKQNLKLINWKFNKRIAINLLKDSWPAILGGLMITIYMKIDQVMIKEMLNETQVGLYSAAVRISEAWYFIPMAISSSIAPYITESKLQNEEMYNKRIRQLYQIMVFISLLISILIFFTSDYVIVFLYGISYYESSNVLLIHIWASIFVFIGVVNGLWFLNENLLVYASFNTFIGALSNIIFNYIFIPIWGIKGAAIATIVSYSISAYFCLFIFKSTRISFFNITKSILLIGR